MRGIAVNIVKKVSSVFIGALLMCLSVQAHAEQKETLGEWDVHYMVVNTPFLTPEVAASYGIVRSKYNALVNISVLNKDSGEAQRVSEIGRAHV